MKMRTRERGYTLVELLMVLFFVFVVFVIGVGGGTLITGNFWYTEASVLKAIQIDHPEAASVLMTKRNVWALSVITVQNSDGSRSAYTLNSNILWNYDLKKMQ